MLDFLTHLFDTSDFPARWHCGNWTAGHGWLHILSDLGVWSAYFAIPCILGYFVLRRRDIPFRTIFWLFGAFILACGTTHLMEALIFWWPAYRLAGVIKLLNALVSWGTVAALVPTIPKALALRTPGDLEREIAARQQAEDALQKANLELESRVEERTAALARVNASLRESQRREKERADELEAILRATPTPIWIAHDPQCHRITGNPASCRLLGLPEGANVSASSPDHDLGSRDFREFLGDQPIAVDELPIQVVCNLLTNAAKYSERGSRIWLTAERQGSDAVLSVKDTGIGIPPDMLPRVFEMFTQVGRSPEKTQSGLGIGLSIVKRLVEMHGGSVEARSEGPGMGSEFIVRLPVVLALAHQQEPVGGGNQQTRPMARRRILVVDDNMDIADSLAMMLEMMGNEVRTAHDGLEGVAAAAAYRPEMILLDIGMPKLNGYEACRRIREQPWGKGILIAAVTGWGQEEDKRRSQEAGFNHHLVKPVGPTAIEKLLVELEARSV